MKFILAHMIGGEERRVERQRLHHLRLVVLPPVTVVLTHISKRTHLILVQVRL